MEILTSKNKKILTFQIRIKKIQLKLLNNLKNAEVIIRIKASNQIEKIKKTDWEDVIKIGNQEKFDLLS